MLKNNQEIIALHRIAGENVYQNSFELADATKHIPTEYTYRELLNPDIEGTRHHSPKYIDDYVMPRRLDDGSLNRWAGIQIEHRAGSRSIPRLLGLVVVRPNQLVALSESNSHINERRLTLVDAWTAAEDQEDSLQALLAHGKMVAKKLYPKIPIATIEPAMPKKKHATHEAHRTLAAVQQVFPCIAFKGEVTRPDLRRTFIRNGVRRGSGFLLS